MQLSRPAVGWCGTQHNVVLLIYNMLPHLAAARPFTSRRLDWWRLHVLVVTCGRLRVDQNFLTFFILLLCIWKAAKSYNSSRIWSYLHLMCNDNRRINNGWLSNFHRLKCLCLGSQREYNQPRHIVLTIFQWCILRFWILWLSHCI